MSQAYSYEMGADGIAIITMDMPGQPVNTMNRDFDPMLESIVSQVESEQELKGVIITSAKDTFFAGGDLHDLLRVQPGQGQDKFYQRLQTIKAGFRRLEQLGKPVVAAINGSALGGGLELALACHARIVLNNPKIQLGLPEVQLGLLPGGGGVTRMVRMFGLEKALPYLNQGTKLNPEAALAAGWVNAVVDTSEALISDAKAWIEANPAPAQPWDQKGYKIPGGTPSSPRVAQMLMVAPAMVRKKTRGLMPAPEVILATATEGAQVDFDTALRIETRALAELVVTPVAKNLISTFFFGLNAINSGASRPKEIAPGKVSKVGVLGAGMMGAGIAYSAAKAGINVVLKDISIESAEKGKAYSAKIMDKAIARGRATEEKKAALLELIQPTAAVADLSDCDLIIEAVFEDENLKAKVTQETELCLGEGVVFASNTSTLPIGMLAESSRDASKFIGLHFFSPVDKMPLVEIICGPKTSDQTLAAAFDFVRQIKKTPIVVNDSLGFFTSRVFGSFNDEGAQLLLEGISPVKIDSLARLAGMPVGPLAVMDEVSQRLVGDVNITNARLIETLDLDPSKAIRPATQQVVPKMLAADRKGRVHGGGFYQYDDQGGKKIWSGLAELFPVKDVDIPAEDIKDRILFRQVIESLKCLQEGVLNTVMDGNIGSVFGIGFPQHTGGVFQYINSYGVEKFVERCEVLAQRYGERFKAPDLLLEKARSGQMFE